MNKFLITSALFTIAYVMPADSAPMYASAFSTQNIGVIQHSIFNMTHNGFETSVSDIGTTKNASNIISEKNQRPQPCEDYRKLYGTMPMYGTMSMYGEYGDDGTVFTTGRSGGDAHQSIIAWTAWQHFNDKEKFNNISALDTKTDIEMIGIGARDMYIAGGNATFGGFGGYVGGDQKNHNIDMVQHGGFVGGYASYRQGRLTAAGSATLGKLYNDISNQFGGTDFDNTWMGVGVNATYDILLDSTFALQPSLYAGYTFVTSPDFNLPEDIRIKNDNLHAFEITPGLRAIKHMGNGWFGIIGAKYVVRMDAGGGVDVANKQLTDLSTDNFAEYGVSLEKSLGPFSATASLNRRDGGRSGWNGGLNLKFVF